jgi:putative membrane protein
MIDDHTKANDRLKTLATQKNIPVPTQMLPQQKTQLDALRNLSGAAFDRAYMDAQMQGHEEAVALFDRASKNLTDNDLKNFASETLPTLRQHNDMVKTHMHGAGGMGGTSNK